VPESFKVLVKELQSLGLSVQVENEGGSISFIDETSNDLPELDINLSGFEREDLFNARS
jgi:DNA-directed RNA polymerase subunit beta